MQVYLIDDSVVEDLNLFIVNLVIKVCVQPKHLSSRIAKYLIFDHGQLIDWESVENRRAFAQIHGLAALVVFFICGIIVVESDVRADLPPTYYRPLADYQGGRDIFVL